MFRLEEAMDHLKRIAAAAMTIIFALAISSVSALAAENHASQLLHIFRDTQSQTIKRYAALAIGNCGSRSEALVFKEHISAATPLTRTAILISSAKLPRDERTHWRKSLTLSDPFEKAIP
jgi:hypothetical protein